MPVSSVSPSTTDYNTQYPFTGTSVLLPLLPEDNYTPEVRCMVTKPLTVWARIGQGRYPDNVTEPTVELVVELCLSVCVCLY